MKKILIPFVLFLVVSNGFSDSTQINLNLKEKPASGTPRIIIGSAIVLSSLVSLAGGIYEIYDYNKQKREHILGCTGEGSHESMIMATSTWFIAGGIFGTILINKGIKNRRIYLKWKLDQN